MNPVAPRPGFVFVWARLSLQIANLSKRYNLREWTTKLSLVCSMKLLTC